MSEPSDLLPHSNRVREVGTSSEIGGPDGQGGGDPMERGLYQGPQQGPSCQKNPIVAARARKTDNREVGCGIKVLPQDATAEGLLPLIKYASGKNSSATGLFTHLFGKLISIAVPTYNSYNGGRVTWISIFSAIFKRKYPHLLRLVLVLVLLVLLELVLLVLGLVRV